MAERVSSGQSAALSSLMGGRFLRLARRYSLCDDDAWEALARGLELALRNHERIRPETAGAWFATVVRHEAMRVRKSRCRELHLDPAVYQPAAEEPEGDARPTRGCRRCAPRWAS
jgi:DNA-directed RNA polymerase specialized sigma24 family protein